MILRGHFSQPVRVEGLEDVGSGFLHVRVRIRDGSLLETDLEVDVLEKALGEAEAGRRTVEASAFLRLTEGVRIRLAYTHDPYFAVSMAGVRVSRARSRSFTGISSHNTCCARCWLTTRARARPSWQACS